MRSVAGNAWASASSILLASLAVVRGSLISNIRATLERNKASSSRSKLEALGMDSVYLPVKRIPGALLVKMDDGRSPITPLRSARG